MTMHALRKGCLAGLAWCLGTLAVLLLALRLLASQADLLTPRVEALLQSQLGAPVSIESLSLGFEREGLNLEVRGVEAALPEAELFSLKSLRLRLDLWRSLDALAPVFSLGRMDGFTLHLYRGEGMSWRWPEPARLPLYVAPEPTFDLASVDAWTQLLLRQRLWLSDSRVLLHDQAENATLHAPELVLSGSGQRLRLAGSVAVASTLLDDALPEQPAASLKADVRPGEQGLNDFSAALQLDMQLEQLAALAELLGPDYAPGLAVAGGHSRLWCRWQAGRLEDVRLRFSLPELGLSQAREQVVLKGLEGRGQWLRRGDGGEAWLSGDVAEVERAEASDHKAPTLPDRWHLTHGDGDWRLRTSAFALESLTAWGDYVILPESLRRPLRALAPRGQVAGLEVGQQSGEWQVDAAVHDLEVSPWDEAPGGGPLDAWVQARDLRGRVMFAGDDDSTLNFPRVFPGPMALDYAEGEVQWVYDGPDTRISGRNLRVGWNGADIQGGFGLTSGGSHQQLGLDLGFQDVDAVTHPLPGWLPVQVLDDELQEWLKDGVGGYVTRGTLKLAAPLGANASAEDIATLLELEVEQGSLPIAPGWPALGDIQGHLRLDQQQLTAEVSQAQSHGVRAENGQVTLDTAAGTLEVTGDVAADANALMAFLQAAPVLESGEMLDDVAARGQVQGQVDLALDLDDPASTLKMDIGLDPRIERLAYTPLPVVLDDLRGDLAWQQRGDQGALSGSAGAGLAGGRVQAEFTPEQVSLSGHVALGELLARAGVARDAASRLGAGHVAWQGRLALGETPRLHLESDLEPVRLSLPAPFTKAAGRALPWTLDADLTSGRVESRLGRMAALRLRRTPSGPAATLNLGTRAAAMPTWPGRGFQLNVGAAEIIPREWQFVTELWPGDEGPGASGPADASSLPALGLALDTPCLKFRDKCLGRLSATGQRTPDGEIDLTLDGSVLAGRLRYRPDSAQPLDVTVGRLVVDRLLALPEAPDTEVPTPDDWMDAVKTRVPDPAAMPGWLTQLPAGRLRVADIVVGQKRFGPLTAYWQANRHRFTLAPVGLTLGEISARGELDWQGSEHGSRTRADLTLAGGDVGTVLARLEQPVAMRSESTRVSASLEWPGAPWQFALSRAGGVLSTDIRDGRFVTLESA